MHSSKSALLASLATCFHMKSAGPTDTHVMHQHRMLKVCAVWDNWRKRKAPRKHQHTASVMRGLRTNCPFPVLPVALKSWEGGGAMETFFADIEPAMDGLEWKTVEEQWLVPFPTPGDYRMASDVSNLVEACEKGWEFLWKKVWVSLDPNCAKVKLPGIVTGDPIPDVR